MAPGNQYRLRKVFVLLAERSKFRVQPRRQHQRLLDDQSIRDLELLKETKREERRDRAAAQLIPHVMSILGKMGIQPDAASGQLAEVVALVQKLDPGLLQIFLQDPNLEPQHREVILRMRPDLRSATTPDNGAAS